MLQRWPLLLAALWWGGLTALSFVAVPLLFAHFGNPAVAGPMAAKLFQVQSWGSVAAALALLLWGRQQRQRSGAQNLSLDLLPWLLLAALAGFLQEFGVAEKILTARATGGNLRLWHAMGTALVVLQWVCALRVLWFLSRRPAGQS